MKKPWRAIVAAAGLALATAWASSSWADGVERPTETFALPALAGNADIQVWDATDGVWVHQSTQYRPTSFSFTVPNWEHWYVLRVWDRVKALYVLEQWFGHFRTHG